MIRPWYLQVFDDRYLAAYGRHFVPERTEREVDGVLGLLGVRPGSRVLDLCCGQGRHAVELAARGYRVTGLDRSQVLLREARAAARARGLRVYWVQGDMRLLPFIRHFDAIINLFTSFGYFASEDDDLRVLREVGALLRPGGGFLLDTFHKADLERRYVPARVEQEEAHGGRVTWRSLFDPATSRLEARGTVVFPDGRRSRLVHSIRAYAPGELADLFRRAGLHPEAWYGGLDGQPLAADSRRLVAVARAIGSGPDSPWSPQRVSSQL